MSTRSTAVTTEYPHVSDHRVTTCQWPQSVHNIPHFFLKAHADVLVRQNAHETFQEKWFATNLNVGRLGLVDYEATEKTELTASRKRHPAQLSSRLLSNNSQIWSSTTSQQPAIILVITKRSFFSLIIHLELNKTPKLHQLKKKCSPNNKQITLNLIRSRGVKWLHFAIQV